MHAGRLNVFDVLYMNVLIPSVTASIYMADSEFESAAQRLRHLAAIRLEGKSLTAFMVVLKITTRDKQSHASQTS